MKVYGQTMYRTQDLWLLSQDAQLNALSGPALDLKSKLLTTRPQSPNIRHEMMTGLANYFYFSWFKKGSWGLLAKVCALSSG